MNKNQKKYEGPGQSKDVEPVKPTETGPHQPKDVDPIIQVQEDDGTLRKYRVTRVMQTHHGNHYILGTLEAGNHPDTYSVPEEQEGIERGGTWDWVSKPETVP